MPDSVRAVVSVRSGRSDRALIRARLGLGGRLGAVGTLPQPWRSGWSRRAGPGAANVPCCLPGLLIRWPMHGNLDVTLMLVFVGGLRQNFDKTSTTL